MRYNISGKIASFIIHNHPLAYLLLALSFVVGIGSYIITPKQYNPEITMPAFVVEVPYPGATAADVETFVTKELEETILDIPGVDEIQSRSFDGGAAVVAVQFTVGFNVEDAKTALRTKLSDHTDKATHTIGQPHITTVDPDSVSILTYGFTHPTLGQGETRERVVALAGELKHVPGVANIDVRGGTARALHIRLDVPALNERGISPADVARALQAQNMLVPVGTLDNGVTRTGIEIDGRVTSAEDAAYMYVAPGVHLGDVADIIDGYEETDAETGVLQKNPNGGIVKDTTVFLSIAKRAGENAITVAENVEAELNRLLKTDVYTGLTLTEYRNTATVAREAIQGLGGNLVTSILIVGLVLLLFLGKRPAVLVAVAIPLTLGWVFFAGLLFGETINRITLFALILSLGLLVDSATVVIENIFRHRGNGQSARLSVVYGVNEVGIGLFLSTLTSVIVFLPTSQISGMMGEYMGPLSFFVPMALIASLGVAYVLTPFIAYIFLRRDEKKYVPGKKEKVSQLQQFFVSLSEKYAQLLKTILASKRLQRLFIGGVFALLGVVMLFPVIQIVHFKMLPTANKNQLYLYIDAPAGSDAKQTAAETYYIGSLVAQEPEVTTMQSFVAEAPVIDFNGLFKSASMRSRPNQSTVRVNLVHTRERERSSEDIVFAIREAFKKDMEVQSYLARGTRIQVLEDPPGPPVQATFVAKVQGPDTKERADLVAYTKQLTEEIDGVVDVQSSLEVPYLVHQYTVDVEKANKAGVPVAVAQQTLRTLVSGETVGQYFHPKSTEPGSIVLHTTVDSRDSMQDIADIRVQSVSGAMVPIQTIVKETQTTQRQTRYRDGAIPTVYITGEMQGRSIVYASIDAITRLLREENLPFDVGDTSWSLFGITYTTETGDQYQIRWGGEWKMTLENFRDLGIAMIVAFFLIFAVLVAQFRSFRVPALIMMTIPLAFIGILPGFAVLDMWNGTYLTATSLIGFIALMGIVVNNAILLLENIGQERDGGATIEEALLSAGKNRLRPILLTSLTTVLGSLTIIGDPVWSGLAWSIVFGLSLSAVLTLGVFPVLYYWFVQETPLPEEHPVVG